MKTYQQWMQAYAVDHTHPTNQAIHKICVPLIMFSIIGLLWSIPQVDIGFIKLNWAFVLIFPAIIFYISLKNILMFLLILLQLFVMLFLCTVLEKSNLLVSISAVIFVLAWIGQFIGHKIEGRKPSFFQDLCFLLIGPLWVNQSLLQRLGLITKVD